MTLRLQALAGKGYRVEFEPAPGDLDGATLFRSHGLFGGEVLVEIYSALAATAVGDTLNVIADTRFSENYIDYSGYRAVSRLLTARGVRILNLVVCDTDPGRRFVVKFGDEVARLAGLDVRSRFVDDLPAAITALAALMGRPADGGEGESGA